MRADERGQVEGTRRLFPVYKQTADGPILCGHVTWSLLTVDLLRELADAIADDLGPDARGRLVLP